MSNRNPPSEPINEDRAFSVAVADRVMRLASDLFAPSD